MNVSKVWVGGFAVLAMMTGCSQPRVNERTPCAPVEQAAVSKPQAAAATPVVTPAPVAVAETSMPVRSTKPVTKSVASDATVLRVKRLVIGTGVKDHMPQGVATLFRQSEVERLYAYVEVENATKDTGSISVSFEPPDGRTARGNVALDVGPSPRWRTWAYTANAHDVGSWTAVVKDGSGRTLARQPFEIAL